MQTPQVVLLLVCGLGMFVVIGGLSMLSHYYTLDGIDSRTVGDGQYGTARFAPERRFNRPIPMYPMIQSGGGGEKTCIPPKRHIISVFKMIQDLLAPSPVKNKSQFQLLMDKLPRSIKPVGMRALP